MKRKYLEAREAKDKEKQPNKVKDFSTDEQSINSTSHGKEESSSKDDSKENVKDKGDVPVVVRGALADWPSLDWGEQGWLKVLGDQEIEVRFGEVDPRYKHPAWERCTQVKKVPASKLLLSDQRVQLVGEDSNPTCKHRWAYWDYKYLAHLLPAEHLAAFPWSNLGFPTRAGEESTLWVGTKGANTPCHQDSYGTNLVAQLIGRKTWTLFPPSDSHLLQPSRLPYEESSVYSLVNFENLEKNSESTLHNLSLSKAYIVTLQPGEVLFVPRHWWHFVYNEEFSISVNTWLPHPLDSKARLEEALVRVQAASLARQLPEELRTILLNPNEADLAEEDMLCQYNLCHQMATQIANEQGKEKAFLEPTFGNDYSALSPSELAISKRITTDSVNDQGEDEVQDYCFKAYQALTAPNVIAAAADVYFKNLNPK